jgi:hypothetical protein
MLPVFQTVASLGASPNYEAFHATEDMRGKLLDYKTDW